MANCCSKVYNGVSGPSTLVSVSKCGTTLPYPIPSYKNNAEALAAGLVDGDVWQTTADNTINLPRGVILVAYSV
jgi:hypothetical protein